MIGTDRLRASVKNMLLALVGILLACAVGELLIRVGTADQKNYVVEMWRYANTLKQRSSDPAIGHEHRPGQTATLQGVDISINSLGMRGPAPLPTEAVQKRIVILGDSTALGWGVGEQSTLRAQLAGKMPPGVEVLNAGVGNMNLSQIVALWARESQRVHADTIILLGSPRAAEIQSPADTNWLVRHSELAALLVTFTRQITSGAAGPDQLVEAYRTLWASGPGRAAMVAALDRLATLQTTLGFNVIVAQIPESHDFNNYRLGFITDIMARESEVRGWTFVDLLPLFQGPPTETFWVTSDDIHLNGDAYRLIADRLLPLLES